MSDYPESVEKLIGFFRNFRGVGRRGAERYVMSLLDWDSEKIAEFGSLLSSLPEKVGRCGECGALIETNEKCPFCSNLRRDRSIICVVENYSQLLSIESSRVFNGLYHILGGKISPLDDEYGENLNIENLLDRIDKNSVRELVIALGADVESRATALFIADMFKEHDLKITQLSQGLPAGANIAFADSATIGAALKNRREL